jgi:hypothetical protein
MVHGGLLQIKADGEITNMKAFFIPRAVTN